MSYATSSPFAHMPPPALTQQDVEHLKILAILHYVWGGITMLAGLGAIFHLGLGIAMLSGVIPTQGNDEVALRAMGFVFASVALAWMIGCFVMGGLFIYGGRNLQRRGSWMLGVIVACLMMPSMPLGTMLGVFAMIVLLRPNVKAVFLARADERVPGFYV